MAHKYMKSVMSAQQHFSLVPQTKIERSTFDRSHGKKLTCDGNWLVPIMVDEVLPGDTFNLRTTTFARFATPVVPIMDNMFAEIFYFFVPNRLVWDNWEKFCGAQTNPGDSTDYIVPNLEFPEGGFDYLGIQDLMGIPPKAEAGGTGAAGTINVLPFRGYNLIYNEWFRDQNLQNSLTVTRSDTGDNWADFGLQFRAKRPDYFTSALPFPQKGPAVTLPLGSSAPVYGNSSDNPESAQWLQTFDNLDPGGISNLVANGSPYDATMFSANGYDMKLATKEFYTINDQYLPPYADLSEATAATINAIREAFQIQKLFERDARGGTRYVEIIKSHFQTVSPDFRLQRPELLARHRTRVNINPVAQTSSTDNTTPQGNLAAFGTFSHEDAGFVHSFVEHGYMIGLLNIFADQTYQQGLNKMWTRKTRFDFYWPAFAHLGEQVVTNGELFFRNGEQDQEVFGYQERYAEYRYKPSEIVGAFRSTYPSPLDVWHLSEKFNNQPVLNPVFINMNAPFTRVIAVENEPQFLVDMYFDYKCTRPMPVYSIPGYIDHF